MADFFESYIAWIQLILIQTTAVFALGLVAAQIVRVPARSHALLLLTFFAATAVPAFSIIVHNAGWGILRPQPVAGTGAPLRVEQVDRVQGLESPVDAHAQTSTTVEQLRPVQPLSASTGRPHLVAILFILAWLAGSTFAALRLVRGVIVSRWLMANATRCRIASIDEALRAACARVDLGGLAVDVFQLSRAKCPLLWCWGRKPRLIIPETLLSSWSASVWSPVLCHELAHWKRRDQLWTLIAELICCAIPWQPLAWWAKRRMGQASEQACDDWVVAAGHEATDYVDILLGLVAQNGSSLQLAALRFASDLSGRVRHLLGQAVARPRPGLPWTLSMILAAVAFGGAAAFCQQGKQVAKIREPEFLQWTQEVAALPATEQMEAVAKKLRELNPGFDGQVFKSDPPGPGKPHRRPPNEITAGYLDGVVVRVSIESKTVTDISPLRALTGLRDLNCYGVRFLSDLSPLEGIALTEFNCSETSVTDFGPLHGMPLERISFISAKVADLSPLKNSQLVRLESFGAPMSDLTPLRGLPLRELYLGRSKVTDLSPLAGASIEALNCQDTQIADLSPLRTCAKLKYLNVRGTRVTLAGVTALQRAVPDCVIEWDNSAWPAPKRSAWSKDDVQVMRALDEPTELECTEMRLTDVVQYLASRHNIPIKLDEVALGRANISIESPVSMNAANITLRKLLPALLSPLKLSFIGQDDGLVITTKADAR